LADSFIKFLTEGSNAIFRISSKNSYGYGPFSPVFRFGTKGAGKNEKLN